MSILAVVILCQEEEAEVAYLTTNVSEGRLRQCLRQRGVLGLVESIEHFHRDRQEGGPGYRVRFSSQAAREEIRQRLHWL